MTRAYRFARRRGATFAGARNLQAHAPPTHRPKWIGPQEATQREHSARQAASRAPANARAQARRDLAANMAPPRRASTLVQTGSAGTSERARGWRSTAFGHRHGNSSGLAADSSKGARWPAGRGPMSERRWRSPRAASVTPGGSARPIVDTPAIRFREACRQTSADPGTQSANSTRISSFYRLCFRVIEDRYDEESRAREKQNGTVMWFRVCATVGGVTSGRRLLAGRPPSWMCLCSPGLVFGINDCRAKSRARRLEKRKAERRQLSPLQAALFDKRRIGSEETRRVTLLLGIFWLAEKLFGIDVLRSSWGPCFSWQAASWRGTSRMRGRKRSRSLWRGKGHDQSLVNRLVLPLHSQLDGVLHICRIICTGRLAPTGGLRSWGAQEGKFVPRVTLQCLGGASSASQPMVSVYIT